MKGETWAEIRRLRFGEGLSLSEIARRMYIDRKTVRQALYSEVCPAPAQLAKASKLDKYKSYIGERLKVFPGINGVRLLGELRRLGYEGGLSILKEHLGRIRPGKQEAFLRIETLPGEQAQVDWAHYGTIRAGGGVRKLSAFVMVMSYSRKIYVEFTVSQSLEDFLGGHVRAFRYFGGVPKKLVYDNLKSVCLARVGSDIRFNPRFLEFSGHYLFEPVLCRPARGNEKGKVESGIKYLRGSFLDGRAPENFDELRTALSGWLEEVANQREHGTTRMQPAERFLEEAAHLRPLPAREPDVAIVRAAQATSQALVSFDGNQYTVPHVYARKTVTVKATEAEVSIFYKVRSVTTHRRNYGRGVIIENPAHYAGLLALKKAARSAKRSDAFLGLARGSAEAQAMLEAYMKGLLGADIEVHGHLERILKQAAQYGRTEVLQAVEQALKYSAFSADYIENLIARNRSARGERESEPISIPSRPDWERATVQERDLAAYDRIYEEEHNEPGTTEQTEP